MKTGAAKKLRGFLIVGAVLLNIQAIANNYYFSSTDGDDSRTSFQAQDSSTPWRSINKLNSIFSSLQAGDVILFKRGDVFYGGKEAKRLYLHALTYELEYNEKFYSFHDPVQDFNGL